MSTYILIGAIVIMELTVVYFGMKCYRAIMRYCGEIVPIYQETVKLVSEKFDAIQKLDEARERVYDKMLEIHELIANHDKTLSEQHRKLLECWKNIEARYSDAYEEFRECSERLQKFEVDIPNNLVNQIAERILETNTTKDSDEEDYAAGSLPVR